MVLRPDVAKHSLVALCECLNKKSVMYLSHALCVATKAKEAIATPMFIRVRVCVYLCCFINEVSRPVRNPISCLFTCSGGDPNKIGGHVSLSIYSPIISPTQCHGFLWQWFDSIHVLFGPRKQAVSFVQATNQLALTCSQWSSRIIANCAKLWYIVFLSMVGKHSRSG